ncbi:MAG: DUF1553 domain-containing protein [Verrucomicrobiales bacterium]|nr:DUF1553 domain-containing protein [Verrucomicrobiales bacterium]
MRLQPSCPRPIANPEAIRWAWVGAFALLLVFRPTAHADPAASFSQEQRHHWAFQPIARPPVPVPPNARDAASDRNAVDAFIGLGLRHAGLTPSPEADRATLIRRVTFDLIGLPPTPEEVAAFVGDPSEEAYERVVDRLLASPHFGERWARTWLDVARYAESEGFKADETRPNIWRYRDYVIQSFNDDKPYDRFVHEQLAGDELWPEDPQARVATGFNRHYPDESNARNLVQRRQEILDDITDTVGYAFTGLSFACARCHDHKWDPITQADYFRLQAFFANTTAADAIPLLAEDAQRRYAERLRSWEQSTQEIREEMACLEWPGRDAILRDYIEKYPPEIQSMLSKPDGDRTPFERQMVAKARLYLDPNSHQYLAPATAAAGRLKGDERARWSELRAQLKTFESRHPGDYPIAAGMTDLGAQCPPTHLLRRGLWNAPGEEVRPGFPSVLGGADAAISPVPAGARTSGRRAALARWLTDPENPLTARVIVNRLWHHHFGRGLVGSPSDLGLKGDRPSHPELLDWLARDVIEHRWSLKHVHRLLVTSATYRQASIARTDALAKDPDNRLHWRFAPRRLEAEMIRDGLLAVAGRLNPAMGGPSIFPPLPRGMASRGGWPTTETATQHERRSIYVFVRRNTRYPMLETFDMPDTHESCARRHVTTSPGQALSLLNSPLTLDWSRSLAARVLDQAGDQPGPQIEWLWRLAWSRAPSPEETAAALRFLSGQRDLLSPRTAAREPVGAPDHPLSAREPAAGAALADLCHAVMNANEFVTLN